MVAQNRLREIQKIIYSLKRNYGLRATVRRFASDTYLRDHRTGRESVFYDDFIIKKAIILPIDWQRKFHYDLSYIAANKNFTYGAYYDRGLRMAIIDLKDLPKGFTLELDDRVSFENENYTIKQISLAEHKKAFILTLELQSNECPTDEATMRPFTMEIDTLGALTFTIPQDGVSSYDFLVSWGDGTIERYTDNKGITYTYESSGTYTIKIAGQFPRILFDNGGDGNNVFRITEWGGIKWSSFENAFYGCANLRVTATDSPDLSEVTNMSQAFRGCTLMGGIPAWDWRTITTAVRTFLGCNGITIGNQIRMDALTDGTDFLSSASFAPFSVSDYSNTLINLARYNTNTGVMLDMGPSQYDDSAVDSKDQLVNTQSWTIIDGGLV